MIVGYIWFALSVRVCVYVYVFLFLTDVMSHSLSFTTIHLYFILEALSPPNAFAKCLGTKIKAMASNPNVKVAYVTQCTAI